MRRLAGALGVSQPVLYSAFAGRQALIDAVALTGFADLATALEAVDASPLVRMQAYLDFAAAHPRLYEAMFMLPTDLAFAADDTPEPLRRAFRGLQDASRAAEGPGTGGRGAPCPGRGPPAAGRRPRAPAATARLDLADRMLVAQASH